MILCERLTIRASIEVGMNTIKTHTHQMKPNPVGSNAAARDTEAEQCSPSEGYLQDLQPKSHRRHTEVGLASLHPNTHTEEQLQRFPWL